MDLLDEKGIRVFGMAEVLLNADVSVVSFGVQTEHGEMNAAQIENARIMSCVLGALEKLRVSSEDIQMSNYNIVPRYNYVNGKSEKNGYQVNNIIKVRLTDLDGIGKLIDAVTAAGANIFNGIEFSVSDKTKHYDEALKKALISARHKAQLIADCQGVKLNETKVVVERESQDATVFVQNARAMTFAADNSANTSIASGKINIKAFVEVVYSIVK